MVEFLTANRRELPRMNRRNGDALSRARGLDSPSGERGSGWEGIRNASITLPCHWCVLIFTVPRKIRQLISDLEKAGFLNRG